MTHSLTPLLAPASVAVVGASAKPSSVGQVMLRQIRLGGYAGSVYGVHPRNAEVEGFRCYPSLHALPEVPDHAVLSVGDHHVLDRLAECAALGIAAVTILSPLHGERNGVNLQKAAKQIADSAGMKIVGGNCNGFYNFINGLWACGFPTREDHRSGGITLLTHSGSLFNAILDTDARLNFNLAVSTGQELTTSLADYMDYALEQPSTRVIGLFMETARDPRGFAKALAKAAARGVPVVALKVGKTEKAARLAASHSGALAGSDAAYDALFEHYGVRRVETIDELAYTLMLFERLHPLPPGGLATIHDSGGERELIVDLAASYGVPFAEITGETRQRIAAKLAPGLPAENPLDAWHSYDNYDESYGGSLCELLRDPGVALGAIVGDRGPGGMIYPEYAHYAEAAQNHSGKPVCIVANHQGSGTCPLAVDATRRGFPVLDGLGQFLTAVRHLFAYRDFQNRPAETGLPPYPDPSRVQHWHRLLDAKPCLDEYTAGQMLRDFGLQTPEARIALSLEAALSAAQEIGYPVVLKTAAPGIPHKSDVGGVALDLRDEQALRNAYEAMSRALGPRVLVSAMVCEKGVEMILGMVRDAQFGPVVVLGSGGVHAEVLQDTATALPPFGPATAQRLLDRLKLRPLLDGQRGAEPVDFDSLTEAIARFSVMAHALGSSLEEFDINPLLALPTGCLALDALAVPDGSDESAQITEKTKEELCI